MSAATAGPWLAVADVNNIRIMGHSDHPIAWTPRLLDGELDKANARLIAAAPELLAALEAIEAITRDGLGVTAIDSNRIAYYAIAKARGQS